MLRRAVMRSEPPCLRSQGPEKLLRGKFWVPQERAVGNYLLLPAVALLLWGY